MSIKQTSIHCERCQRSMLHAKQHFGGVIGLFLTVLTLGLFLPFWLVLDHMNGKSAWKCQTCGRENRGKNKGIFG